VRNASGVPVEPGAEPRGEGKGIKELRNERIIILTANF